MKIFFYFYMIQEIKGLPLNQNVVMAISADTSDILLCYLRLAVQLEIFRNHFVKKIFLGSLQDLTFLKAVVPE